MNRLRQLAGVPLMENQTADELKRGYNELSPQERQVFDQIQSVNDIKSVEVVTTWYDDHILCVGARINGIPVGFWWVGDQGAFEYADESPRAKAAVFEIIKAWIEEGKELDSGDWG